MLSGNVTAPENLFRFQSSVIRELAREESCIIVGRAAGYVLDQEEELERLIRIFGLRRQGEKSAARNGSGRHRRGEGKTPDQKDGEVQTGILQVFHRQRMAQHENYDLTINITNLDLDQTAELVKVTSAERLTNRRESDKLIGRV